MQIAAKTGLETVMPILFKPLSTTSVNSVHFLYIKCHEGGLFKMFETWERWQFHLHQKWLPAKEQNKGLKRASIEFCQDIF